MTYKDDSSRMGLTEYALECYLLHVPFSLCIWILLFFCSSQPLFCHRSHCSGLLSWPPHCCLLCRFLHMSHRSYFLSSCLLIAMCVAFVVVVLSLHLLVTKEVAPPAFRVVYLSGRPCTPHPLHLPFI